MPGQFLLKDVVLLAAALWSLGEALPEARQREAMEAKSGRGGASTGEGETVKTLFSEKLPNVPGKTLTVVSVDYRPGGFSTPHRHPASGFVFAYVLSGAIRSQVEGEPLGVYRVGQSWTEPPNAHHIVSANGARHSRRS